MRIGKNNKVKYLFYFIIFFNWVSVEIFVKVTGSFSTVEISKSLLLSIKTGFIPTFVGHKISDLKVSQTKVVSL